MSSTKPIIEPYSGATFGPFFRSFFLLGTLFLGVALVRCVFAGSSDTVVRFAVCVIGVVVLGIIVVLLVCNYTEMDSEQITSFFDLGR